MYGRRIDRRVNEWIGQMAIESASGCDYPAAKLVSLQLRCLETFCYSCQHVHPLCGCIWLQNVSELITLITSTRERVRVAGAFCSVVAARSGWLGDIAHVEKESLCFVFERCE
jgi:hypothetical protein